MLTAPGAAITAISAEGHAYADVGPDRLRVHDDVRAAVTLAGDDLHTRNGRLAVGVEQLGAVADDAAVLLVGAGQETRVRRRR